MKTLKSIASVLALVAILLGVPLVLIWLVGWPGPDHVPGWIEIRRTVVQRDFGTNFLLGALALIGWVLWLQVLWATVWEVSVNVRRVRANARPRRAPLVAAPIGRAVGVSVMAMLALFASTGPGTALAVGPLQASASSAALARTPATATIDLAQSQRTPTPQQDERVALRDSSSVTSPVTTGARIWNVEAGDNLWDIAESALGDGSRVDELVALNPNLSASMVIHPGEQIRLPADATGGVLEVTTAPGAGDEVVVERGDNLWNLTEARWGSTDMQRIERVADANQINDPNLIYPGDVIDLRDPSAPPTADHQQASSGRQTVDVELSDLETASQVNGSGSTADNPGGFNGFAAPQVGQNGQLPPPSVGRATVPRSSVEPANAGDGQSEESTAGILAWDLSLLLSGGLLGLIAARRKRLWRTLRGMKNPSDDEVAMERRLRASRFVWGEDSPEASRERDERRWRQTFFRVGTVASAAGTEVMAIVAAEHQPITVYLSAAVELPGEWRGAGHVWTIEPQHLANEEDDSGGDEEIALMRLHASIGRSPAPAMTELGTTSTGQRVFVNVEALGTLEIGGPEQSAEAIVNAVVMGLASNESLSSAALIGVGIDNALLLGHPGAMSSPAFNDALTQAEVMIGSRRFDEPRSVMRAASPPYGEVWEPAIIIAGSDASKVRSPNVDGVALVSAAPVLGPAHVLAPEGDEWSLRPLGIRLTPVGVPHGERVAIASLLANASTGRPVDGTLGVTPDLIGPGDDTPAHIPVADGTPADLTIDRPLPPATDPVHPTAPPDNSAPELAAPHHPESAAEPDSSAPVLVRVLGSVRVETAHGPVGFQRSKSQELLVWLAFHRDASTRTGARGALWNFNIRETPFRNVISDLRQSLDLAVPPPSGETWLERTETELLPLHPGVGTDAELVERALREARDLPADDKIEILEPAVELVEGVPFAGANYLWPDAEGLVSRLIMMTSDAFAELADAYREVGNAPAAVAVARRGLGLFSGHERLVAVYLQALVDTGDDEAVTAAWNEYEATLCDDAWGPYEPSPELVALRRRLRQGRGAFAPPTR